MTSSERLVAKSLKLPVHPIVSRRSRRARASLLAAPTTTRLIQPSLETPSANTPRARARARPDRPRPRSIPARRITPPSRPRARPPRARPRPRVRRARVDTRRDASTRGTPRRTVSRPRARRSRGPSASPAPCGDRRARVGESRRARADDGVVVVTSLPMVKQSDDRDGCRPRSTRARARDARADRGRLAARAIGARRSRSPRRRVRDARARTRATRRDDDEVSRAFNRRRTREFVGSTRCSRDRRGQARRARDRTAREDATVNRGRRKRERRRDAGDGGGNGGRGGDVFERDARGRAARTARRTRATRARSRTTRVGRATIWGGATGDDDADARVRREGRGGGGTRGGGFVRAKVRAKAGAGVRDASFKRGDE